jgi:hypothetical protein
MGGTGSGLRHAKENAMTARIGNVADDVRVIESGVPRRLGTAEHALIERLIAEVADGRRPSTMERHLYTVRH